MAIPSRTITAARASSSHPLGRLVGHRRQLLALTVPIGKHLRVMRNTYYRARKINPTMQRIAPAFIVITSAILLSTCVTLASGADQIRLTGNAADVASCKALGNIQVPKNDQGLVDGANAQNQFRNQAVGLDSNVALVTEGLVGIPVAGIAYRCP